MLAHPVLLEVAAAPRPTGSDARASFTLTLRDLHGNGGSGRWELHAGRTLHDGTTWAATLAAYRTGRADPDLLRRFGRDLLDSLLADRALFGAWQAVLGRAAGAPLLLTVQCGAGTGAFARLPLELLHDDAGFLFASSGSGLQRTLLGTPARQADLPPRPRVLFAWACPAGEAPFDPVPHRRALQRRFGADLHEVAAGSLADLQTALAEHRPHVLHLLVHGRGDGATPAVVLQHADGRADVVDALRLGNAVAGAGLQFAFLCACNSASDGPDGMTGVAQHLLTAGGGDIPCVVATQAMLPSAGSAELAGEFYRLLLASRDPAVAIGQARVQAFGKGSAWSIPILLARPRPFAPVDRACEWHDYGGRGALRVFVGRDDERRQLDAALLGGDGPPVTAVRGIGGVGKSSLLYRWLADCRAQPTPPFDAVISYCAYRLCASWTSFLEFVLERLGRQAPGRRSPRRALAMTAAVLAALQERRVLLAIDGLERWLRGWQDTQDLDERFQDADRQRARSAVGLGDLLHGCTALTNGSRVVFTSRALPLALDGLQVHCVAGAGGSDRLQGLAPAEGASLLRQLGMTGADADLEGVSREYWGHPLALTLLARMPPGSLPRTGTGDGPLPQELTLDHKLRGLLQAIEQHRRDDVPLLVAAACFGDAPLAAIAAVVGRPTDDAELWRRLQGLAGWGLLELYESAAGETWLAVHPLVKKHFAGRADRRTHAVLGEAFARIPVPADACTLEQARPRLWAIDHAELAGQFDRCCELLFQDLGAGKLLCEWFPAWGYLEHEVELELRLLPRVPVAWQNKLRVSLAHNLRVLGRNQQALEILRGNPPPRMEDHHD